MDTKWKKWKIGLSFTAFVVGLSLLIGSLCVFLPAGREGPSSMDYQDTATFRNYISEELDVLLSAGKQEDTVGGHWDAYAFIVANASRGTHAYVTEPGMWTIPIDELLPAFGTDVATAAEAESPMTPQRIAQFWDRYMGQMAQDKNLLYAVERDGKLLYTNVDGLTDSVGRAWNADFFSSVDEEIYNFSLVFNRYGNGKVEIDKAGDYMDVYGDGWYTGSSDWCLPGYNNLTVDGEGVVIYMAAAVMPQIYLITDADGNTSYAGHDLYELYHDFHARARQFGIAWLMLICSVPLLVLALCMHKSKRQGDKFLLRLMGSMWLLAKVLVLIILPAGILWLAALWQSGGPGLVVACFWLLYLGVLDLIGNRKRQKLFLREYFWTKELQRPVQQRLARRVRFIVILGVLAFCATMVAGVVTLFCLNNGDYFFVITGACFLAGAFLTWKLLSIGRKDRRLAEDIGALIGQIEAVKSGNLTDALTLPEDSDLRQAAQELSSIQQGLDTALQEQMKSERMKVELITNVSHDIKTPLTSIISYVELLRQEELSATAREFVDILGEKSQRLKLIVQDVFEVSKAAAGQLPLNVETLDLAKLLRQTLADMAMPIEKSGLTLRLSIPETPVTVRADGQRLYRVFQNLLQNALQYSLPGSRVFLSLTETGGGAVVQMKNTSAMALDETVDFTERFVRGDESRTDGGSGLGLSIAKSFTEASGGSLAVTVDADLFTVTVTLPLEIK